MSNLPPELLEQIFDLLEQDDILQCMLACQLWKTLIQDFYLFRTLSIYSPAMLVGVSATTQERPRLLNNVEKLTLHSYNADEKTWIDFLEALPNVRDFYYIGPLFQGLDNDYTPDLPWCKSIEKIIVDSGHRIVDKLIFNNMCPNLTDLNISSTDNMSLKFLNNTPALKSLTLCMSTIEYDDINKIHEMLPNLKVLGLRDKVIMGESLNRTVTPAYSITRLALDLIQTPNLEMELELLQYIIKKYPNLEELIYETNFSADNDDERKTLHRVGWDPLFKNLAPTLRTLHTTYTCKIPNLLETLDEHKCQIENLKVGSISEMTCPKFSLSQQAMYIRTLSINSINIESLEWLQEMKVLERLEITDHQWETSIRIDFNDIIDYAPPTLKSLLLSKVFVKSRIKSVKQSNIETLEFVSSNLIDGFVMFVDRHFSRLKSLTIKRCQHNITALLLRSVELKLFYYVEGSHVKEVNVLIRTIYDGDERLYSTRGEKYKTRYASYYENYNGITHPPVKSQPADQMKIKPNITLVCFNVANVILHF
jgi:hypothetical protein